MKGSQRKDFFREIRKSMGRYLSILFIVALGVAFYAGVRSAEPDMRQSADQYFDETNLMDIRILGTLGLTQDDLEAIRKIDGVTGAEGGYSAEFLTYDEDKKLVVNVMSLAGDINRMTVEEGRLPEAPDECFVDSLFMEARGLKIGDTLTFEADKGEDVLDTLVTDTFTIVGSGSYSYYLSWDRGTSGIGSGKTDAFVMVEPESFALDVYTVIYASVDSADGLLCYSDSYEDRISGITDQIEAIADGRCEIRYASVKAEADEKIADAKADIADGEQQIEDARQELADAEAKLEDARAQIADGEKELADGKKTFADGEKELADGQKQLDDGQKAYDEAKALIAEHEQKLADGKAELAKKEQELADARTQLEDGRRQLESAKGTLNSGRSELAAKEEELNKSEEAVKAGWKQYNDGKAQLASLQQTLAGLQEYERQIREINDLINAGGQTPEELERLQASLAQVTAACELTKQAVMSQDSIRDAMNQAGVADENSPYFTAVFEQVVQTVTAQQTPVLEESRQTLLSYEAQIKDGRAQIADAKAQLEEAGKVLNEKENELAEAPAKLADGERQIEEAKRTIADAEAALADAKEQLAESGAKLADARKELESGSAELESHRQEITDAEAKLADARAEVADGEAKLADARKEFDESVPDAEEKIADGRQQVADAEEKLADLKEPEWYVLDRNSIQTYVEFDMDAERIGAIGKVFPAIFFLVAALVSLTTMTRMIEEERTQIGTLKALGYSKASIAAKYLFYALSASVAGGILGVLVGSKVLPAVIIAAYSILYSNLKVVVLPLHMDLAVSSVLLAVACTVGAAYAACYKELLSTPAELMRPPAPKEGKRVLLERITFLWKRLNFTQKSTVRNLFRYKKRFFMTVFGIGGCMALLMVGFGLGDSIRQIVNNQYKNIWIYDGELTLDEDLERTEEETLAAEVVEDYDNITQSMFVRQNSIDFEKDGVTKSGYLFVPEYMDQVSDFLVLKNRVTQERYALSNDGVIITEKLARLLGVSAGDQIILKDSDTKSHTVTVEAIAENYLYHYVYMTPALYEQLYGSEPDYNKLLLKFQDTSKEAQEQLGNELLSDDRVSSVSFVTELESKVQDMMRSLDLVVWVLIISAGLLAFVVLYNLNNINVTERRRELATIKVLGFYDNEVAEYVYRENVFLTVFGITAGIALGIVLHQFVIRTCEIDMIMFGRTIKPLSYLYSTLLTLFFTVAVNFSMYFKLKKIDMVESLKSIE